MAGGDPTITWSEEGVPFAPAFDDVYCSRSGVAQADLVFVEGSDLPARFADGEDVTIIETGLGLGLNLMAAVRAWTRAGGGGALRHASIELYPVPPARLREVHARLGTLDGATEALLEAYPELLDAGAARMGAASGPVDLRLVRGDGAAALRRLEVRADAVFLDGFAPAKNPGLWNDDVYAELARLARPGATIASYTAAGAVRAGLDRAGFDVERRDGFARKRHRLAGRRRQDTSRS